jgi:hypothetical protein
MTTYHIRIQGHLDEQWTDWFDGVTIIHKDNGETLIICPEADQAALHGLLKKIRNLGLSLLSLQQIRPDQDEATGTKE